MISLHVMRLGSDHNRPKHCAMSRHRRPLCFYSSRARRIMPRVRKPWRANLGLVLRALGADGRFYSAQRPRNLSTAPGATEPDDGKDSGPYAAALAASRLLRHPSSHAEINGCHSLVKDHFRSVPGIRYHLGVALIVRVTLTPKGPVVWRRC